MEPKTQLQKNATVLTAGGEEIGTLDRLVFSPQSKIISHLIVRTGGLLSRVDKVIPVDLIARATGDRVILSETAGDPEYFLPFEEQRVVDKKGEFDLPATSGSTTPELIGYPEPDIPYVPAPGEEYVTQTGRNIPEGTVALKEGAKVMSSDGKHVGNVELVIATPNLEQVTDLLISSGLFSKATKLIPMDWVRTMTDNEVYLRVEEHSVAELDDVSIIG
ncbi:MAG TPA: PRC-barrel domain-containing protein [Anaerolineales bacterium]|nr:PRC-barrel domain-containing protein [Anaerolineales bacterium]